MSARVIKIYNRRKAFVSFTWGTGTAYVPIFQFVPALPYSYLISTVLMPGVPMQAMLTTGTYMDAQAPGGADNPLVKGYLLRYNQANIIFDADIFKG